MRSDRTLGSGIPLRTFLDFNFVHKGLLFFAAAVIIQGALLPAPVYAEMYQWQDADGNIVYGDSPPPEVKASETHVRTDKIIRPEKKESPRDKGPISQEARLRDVRDISVILYMTEWCPYCKKTREYLNSKGIRYTEYNIDKDRSKNEEMRKKSGSNGVPVLDIEGIIIRGHNPDGIAAAIETKRKESN